MIVTDLFDEDMFLPKRRLETHKGNYGKILIVGGSIGYTGAPTLSARAAMRAGAGLVYLGVPASIYDITAAKNDEAMPFPLPSDSSGYVSTKASDAVLRKAENCDVCAIGPGLGKCAGTQEIVRTMLSNYEKPLILDADGLNVLPDLLTVLRDRQNPAILTPHEGEFKRLGGELTGQRHEDALRFSQTWNCILILKGPKTVIAFPTGEVYRINRGNPGMASGGTGDVLTGILAALLGQFSSRLAITTAVFLHSLSGDLCRERYGEYSLTATDLIEMLPEATMRITRTAF